MDAYEMALAYFPRLWDESRLDQLVTAGKLTEKQKEKIIKLNS